MSRITPEEPIRRRVRERLQNSDNSASEIAALLTELARDEQLAHSSAPLETVAQLLHSGALDNVDAFPIDAFELLGTTIAQQLEQQENGHPSRSQVQHSAWSWLNLVRSAPLPRLIHAANATTAWMTLILRVIDASNFTLARLFAQRLEQYGPRTLFHVPSRGESGRYTWIEVNLKAERIAKGLLALLAQRGTGPVAILSENCYEMAVLDLACLSSGIINVMIPTSATDADVSFILEQTGASVLVTTQRQLGRYKRTWHGEHEVKTVVLLDGRAEVPGAITLDALEQREQEVRSEQLVQRRASLRLDDLCSMMFTSGTSGRPKGIKFSQRNLVSKRFARGLAIPGIDDTDRFLAFLPLCHTFGRYLEMLGSVFWGASYVFLEDHAPDAMIESFRAFSPTIFISIPLKWSQLYDRIQDQLAGENDSEEAVHLATRQVVGEQLRWGLSAAGYLAPGIFRHFQQQGVELMSGFGMTEATGGITMTPPGKYRDGTLGVPLPGIEIDVADELLIRGPYVMIGYVDDADNAAHYRDDWLRTGDVMEQDDEGYLRLVDRKKDIYKNIKGQTVAPQRVENLFRDLESVKRVYVVGDGQAYNTALIVPNPLGGSTPREEQYDHFGSVVATVNRFVAPHERVIDFAILDRDFDPGRGELTTKGTFRRKQIEQSMSEVIGRLYQRGRLRVAAADLEVRLPNWLFQALGVTVGGVKVEGNRIVVGSDRTLCVDRVEGPDGERLTRIGSCLYRLKGNVIDMGQILAFPVLWVGNDELVTFASLEGRRHYASKNWPQGIELVGPAERYQPTEEERTALTDALASGKTGFSELHLAARVLASDDEIDALDAVRLLEEVLLSERRATGDIAQHLLRGTATHPSLEVRRRAVQCLLPVERKADVQRTIERFLSQPEDMLDEQTIGVLCERALPEHVVSALFDLVRRAIMGEGSTEQWRRQRQIESVLELLVSYGGHHPGEYASLQFSLASLEALVRGKTERDQIYRARTTLAERFRRWLGAPQRIAVDPDTQREFRWEDVLTFDDDVDSEERRVLVAAMRGTCLVQEAIFLVSRGTVVRLSDIRLGGVWISKLRQGEAESVFRATVHTRYHGRHDFVLHLNRLLSPDEIAEEFLWLRCAGRDSRLVATFGGYWRQHGLWTEEFISGEAVDRFVRRLARQKRLRSSWPFIIWDAATAYFEFWQRTGRQYVPDPSPSNFVVAPDDFQPGARIISIARRRPFSSVAEEMMLLRRTFGDPIEADNPAVEGVFSWRFLFSALIEAVGLEEGLALLEGVGVVEPSLAEPVEDFCEEVRQRGFVPRQLHFAIFRYHGWASVATEATDQARARMLKEIYGTYRLGSLGYPEARVRLFRDTVLQDSAEPVLQTLDELIDDLRHRRIERHQIVERIGQLRRHVDPDSPTAYFLTRLTYPHVEPGDAADMLSAAGASNDVVVSLEDSAGRPYQIRRPVSPHEVTQLQRLFRRASMEVSFHADHKFLVAIDAQGNVIGGLFFELDLDNQRAHLDRIVVTERRRKRGVSDGLMNELFKRVSAAGVGVISVGFYRPGYFYRFGFAIEKRYPGLVKHLP